MSTSVAPAPPAAILSPRVRSLHAYWESLRGLRPAPAWTEIDPASMRSFLSFVVVTDFIADPFDVRFRIVGTSIVEAYGEDFTGRRLGELEATGGHALWYEIYQQVIAATQPRYGRYFIVSDRGERMDVDFGIFPLSMDGRRVDRTIEVEDWSDALRLAPRILMLHDWRVETLGP
jgi:hypothetical protein